MTEIIIYGILISSLYALLATGFTMIYGVGGVINLTHGTLIIFSGYVMLLLSKVFAVLDVYTSCVIAILLTMLLSILIYKVLIRPFMDSEVTVMIVTLVFALTVEQLIMYFNPRTRIVPNLVDGGVEILGITVVSQRVLGFIVAIVFIAGLWIFVKKTKLGKAIMASSMDRTGCYLVGINAEQIQFIVWGISGLLAGVGGIFLGSFSGVSPIAWRMPLLLSFCIVVLGGMGNIPGAMASAYLIGFTETIIAFQFSPKLRGIPSLIIVSFVLLFRSRGLFAKSSG